MNTTTENDRKLSEALKSLSLEPVAFDSSPRWPGRLRKLGASLALATACASSLAIYWYLPDGVERIMTSRSDGGQEVSLQADLSPAQLVQGAQATPGLPAPASRDVTGSGYVVAPEFTSVFSKYEGKIVEIAVKVGDRVAPGQVLLKLDDAGARFALDEAVIAKQTAELVLAARKIEAEKSAAMLRRNQTLAATNAVSKQQLADAETGFESAVNSVAQAKQSLAKAELDIRKAQERVDELFVRAPIAGTVTMLRARVGDSVLARVDSVRENESLVTITNTDTMVIDADVAETNVALMRPGLEGEAVLDGFPDQPFKVTVDQVAPVVSSEKGTISLRLFLASPPAGIRPNMAARITIASSANSISTEQQGTKP